MSSGGSNQDREPWTPTSDCPKSREYDVKDIIPKGGTTAVQNLKAGDSVYFRPGIQPVVDVSSRPEPNFEPFGVIRNQTLYHCLSIGVPYEGSVVVVDTNAAPPAVHVRARRSA